MCLIYNLILNYNKHGVIIDLNVQLGSTKINTVVIFLSWRVHDYTFLEWEQNLFLLGKDTTCYVSYKTGVILKRR